MTMAGALTSVLAQKGGDERGVVTQIARQQTSRLLRESKGPLETVPLHPWRRLSLASCEKVECRPYSDQHRRFEPGSHPCHPFLLLRYADADPYDVGTIAAG